MEHTQRFAIGSVVRTIVDYGACRPLVVLEYYHGNRVSVKSANGHIYTCPEIYFVKII